MTDEETGKASFEVEIVGPMTVKEYFEHLKQEALAGHTLIVDGEVIGGKQ